MLKSFTDWNSELNLILKLVLKKLVRETRGKIHDARQKQAFVRMNALYERKNDRSNFQKYTVPLHLLHDG